MEIQDLYQVTMIADGLEPASEEEYLTAWQYLVNTGAAYELDGGYGRKADELIACGLINPFPFEPVFNHSLVTEDEPHELVSV